MVSDIQGEIIPDQLLDKLVSCYDVIKDQEAVI